MANNANTPSSLAELKGTRLEISVMPRGNEKRTCMITSYYRAIAAIFIARIYSIIIMLATLTLIFRYGQGRSRAYVPCN